MKKSTKWALAALLSLLTIIITIFAVDGFSKLRPDLFLPLSGAFLMFLLIYRFVVFYVIWLRAHLGRSTCMVCGTRTGTLKNIFRHPIRDGYICHRCFIKVGSLPTPDSPFGTLQKTSAEEVIEKINNPGKTPAGAPATPIPQPDTQTPSVTSPAVSPVTNRIKTFQTLTFQVPKDFTYSENGNTAVLTAPQDHTVIIIAANVIKSQSAGSKSGLIHSLAIESFVGQFEDIREREDFETGWGKTARVGANFSGRMGGSDYHCSITSLMNESMQYAVSYAYRLEEDQDEIYYDDFLKLLKSLIFT